MASFDQQGSNGHPRLAQVLSIVVPTLVALATAFIAWGNLASDQRSHERRIEKLEAAREKTEASDRDRDTRTAERLAGIETKLEMILRSLGVTAPIGPGPR